MKAGNYFTLNSSFAEEQNSNAIILSYTFDGAKFEYANFTAAEGVTVIDRQYGEGYAKITVMVSDYSAENLGDVMLRAKEDAVLSREKQSVALTAEYVLKDGDVKSIHNASASAYFTTTSELAVEGDTNDDHQLF